MKWISTLRQSVSQLTTTTSEKTIMSGRRPTGESYAEKWFGKRKIDLDDAEAACYKTLWNRGSKRGFMPSQTEAQEKLNEYKRAKELQNKGYKQSNVQRWFGKKFLDLTDDEIRLYNRLTRADATARKEAKDKDKDTDPQEEETIYLEPLRYKKDIPKGTQMIQCSCGFQIVTRYLGAEIKQHKKTAKHRRAVDGKPDESWQSLVDRQWNFTDEELLGGIEVKKV